jgi:hypothetical protein
MILINQFKKGNKMLKELELILKFMRPAFSRHATYLWFVVCCFGFICRADTFGVSSIVRALFLEPTHYTSLLNFFHSTAWNADKFMCLWWKYICQNESGYTVGDRIVLAADHTKIPKDARKMPAVVTLHQDSETGSKPSYFRGHHWGCIGMIIKIGSKFRLLPICATIQEGSGNFVKSRKVTKTVQVIQMAIKVSQSANRKSILVLDAFFSVGTVFDAAKKYLIEGVQLVHILTRSKKNITAFEPVPITKTNKRGRKKKYGKKIKLMSIFKSKKKFKTAKAFLYKQEEKIEYLIFDLLWKPTKGMVRFILIRSSYGEMVLMTSDMQMEGVTAIELYCRRMTIETLFDVLKNTMGGLCYHFWSKHLSRASRAPIKNSSMKQKSTNLKCTKNTLEAIEKFVNLQLFVIGVLQIISKKYSKEVITKANCWLRTISKTPSEFVTRMALGNSIRFNLHVFAKDWMTQLILQRSKIPNKMLCKKKIA